jgi:hypothetical protein
MRAQLEIWLSAVESGGVDNAVKTSRRQEAGEWPAVAYLLYLPLATRKMGRANRGPIFAAGNKFQTSRLNTGTLPANTRLALQGRSVLEDARILTRRVSEGLYQFTRIEEVPRSRFGLLSAQEY